MININGEERQALKELTFLVKKELNLQQKTHQLKLKIDMLQRRLLSLQRKRIQNESPEEKQVRLLMRQTGMTEDEIRKGLDIIKSD